GGTGIRAPAIAAAGWQPVTIDISTGQLRHARTRTTVVVGDATALPVRDSSVDAAIAVLCHTDVPDYTKVVREAARVLRPGRQFVHIGIHPCFCGYFADWSDRRRMVLTPGYNDRVHSYEAWCPTGVRARLGAWHITLADLMECLIQAGLAIDRVREAGPAELPDLLGIAATKR
ncbi:MAG TPA: class I SAM-dependent methyltransferase, partial [Micromonosporaceae bacterium]|nr:class I SAM-dependent methyltransferase [Micromonosporaceae bacterium]